MNITVERRIDAHSQSKLYITKLSLVRRVFLDDMAVRCMDRRSQSLGWHGEGDGNGILPMERMKVHAATNAALETADIALMTDDLHKLSWLLRHSRRTRRVIMQNIGLSLGIKAVFLIGLANLWLAIAADMGASLLVTLNGLRLLRSGQAEGWLDRPTFDQRRVGE